jgi:hypothetical protein
LLHAFEYAAGFNGDGVIDGIDSAYAIHAASDNTIAVPLSSGTATKYQTGIAALRHDRNFMGIAQLDDGGDFFGGSRPDDSQRLAGMSLATVGQVRACVASFGQYVRRSDDRRHASRNSSFRNFFNACLVRALAACL